MEKTNFEKHREEQLSNPEFRKRYEALEPHYNLIRSLIRRRNELQLTQSDVATITGIQQPAISRLEKGGNSTIATLFRVADALDLHVELKTG